MAFELFRAGRTRSQTPSITLHKDGNFSMNKACFDSFFKDKQFAEYLFDAETSTIAIRPVAEDQPHAYPIRTSGNQPQLSARAFCNKNGIEFEAQTRRYGCSWDDRIGAIVLSE